VGHNCRIGSGMIIYPARTVESDVVLFASQARRIIDKNITYEESDHHHTRAAHLHKRLYPRKGAIQVGADADLAIIHPATKHTVVPSQMETNADWSPYDGWDLAGFARTTISRGEVIVSDYKVVGRQGRGQWLPRTFAGLEGTTGEMSAMRLSRGPLSPLRLEDLKAAGIA